MNFEKIDPLKIDVNPKQPRKYFVEKDLEQLIESIKKEGVLQPLIVSKNQENQRFTLVAGERRLRASRALALSAVPVVIKQVSSLELLKIALVENLQREDLNVIEEAHAYKALIDEHGYTQEQCAKELGLERSTVANTIRLLNLPLEVHKDLVDKSLSFGHARALLGLEKKSKILEARNIVLAKDLSVRQTEALCKKIKRNQNKKTAFTLEDSRSNLDYMAESLRFHLRTKVNFVGSSSRGKIEISYFSSAELERIIELVGKKLE